MDSFVPQPASNDIVRNLRMLADQSILLAVQKMQHFVGQAAETEILREEHCADATLHRGYFHPSPVYDLIIGNTKRGKLCRKTSRRLTHHFYYDCNNKLIRIEYLSGDRISHVEHLRYNGQSIDGITVDCNGFLSAVTEETYEHGRIVFFSLTRCYHINGTYTCFDYHTERYHYDDEGLCKCHFVNLSPQSGYLIDRTYTFERDSGFLVSYSPDSTILNAEPQAKYTIRKKRKA